MAMTKAEYSRKWREENPEKVTAYRKKWRADNAEKVREYSRNKRIRAETDVDLFVDIIFRGIIDRTRSRNDKGRDHDLDIDRDYLKRLLSRQKWICATSGVVLTMKKGDPNVASPDRKNPNKGYVKGNIQMVAAQVNVAKNKSPNKQFLEMVKNIYITQKKKGNIK